jgi:hypothetical protein
MTEVKLRELFRRTHQCRLLEMPPAIHDAYDGAGSIWRGTPTISGYAATPPLEDATRMLPDMIMRG